jgi:type II secretion system protein I
MRERGFTLLEVLVATTLMAVAVVGLLGSLRTSLSNAARLTDYDRAALLARRQMDELLAARLLPKGVPIEGAVRPAGDRRRPRRVARPRHPVREHRPARLAPARRDADPRTD